MSDPLPAAATRAPSLADKLLYGVGEMPITVMMVLFGIFVLFFYNSVMGLPATWVGAGIFLGLVVDALADPYVGYLSDRTRHRFGRRHAFMLPGALLMGPCLFLLFSPPRNLGHAGLFVWLLLCSLALRVTSAVYRIPYLSLGAELTRDHDGRTVIVAVRALFGLLGMLAGAGLSFLLFFPTTGSGDPKLYYGGYPQMGLVFGALMSGAGLVSTAGTWRYRTAGRPDPQRDTLRFFAGFQAAMRNQAFRSIWFSFTLFFLGVVLNATLALHYFTWYAQIHAGAALSTIQTAFYTGAMAGVLCWLALARRAEKKTLYLAATLATALLLCGATVLVGPGRPFGTGNPLPLVIGHALAGLLASAVWVIPASMAADVADWDELTTGLRREGMFFGILNFGEKIAAGGAVLAAGVLLGASGKLLPRVPSGAPASASAIAFLYGVAPAAVLLAAAACVVPYRLNRRTVREVQHTLDASRGSATPVKSVGTALPV